MKKLFLILFAVISLSIYTEETTLLVDYEKQTVNVDFNDSVYEFPIPDNEQDWILLVTDLNTFIQTYKTMNDELLRTIDDYDMDMSVSYADLGRQLTLVKNKVDDIKITVDGLSQVDNSVSDAIYDSVNNNNIAVHMGISYNGYNTMVDGDTTQSYGVGLGLLYNLNSIYFDSMVGIIVGPNESTIPLLMVTCGYWID